MESKNPYQTPSTDVAAQYHGETDQTSPFSASGRFGRLSFIAWGTIVGVISNIVSASFGGSEMLVPSFDSQGMPIPPDINGPALAVIAIVSLICLVFFVIFLIRRCHDFNGSGWLSLIALIPLVNLVFFLYLWLKRGDEGANNYGPPRVTPGWEKVLGLIGVVLMVVVLVLVVVSVMGAVMVGATGGPGGLS